VTPRSAIASLGEVVDHRAPDALEVGVAVYDRLPLGAKLAGDAGTKGRLVDVTGGLCLAQKRRGAPWVGEAEPAPVGGGAGHVGGDEVGVKGGIAGARGAVAEGHRYEAGAGLDRRAPLAALDEAGDSLQIGNCLSDSMVVSAQDRAADLGRADRVEQRYRLGRGEADVVAEDRIEPALAPVGIEVGAGLGTGDQDFAGPRMLAGENGGVGVAIDLAGEAELVGQLPHPVPRRLAGLGVVIVAAFDHGVDPVVGVGTADLRHSYHALAVQRAARLHRGEPQGS
jgi:hypothetical protein